MKTLKAVLMAAAMLAAPAFAANTMNTPDGWITTKTKLSLLTTANVKSTTLHVDTTDGVVTLYGTVPTAGQKDLAERTARDVKGVHSVRNLLQVVPAPIEKTVARSDADIKKQASKMLKEDPALKDSSIDVKSVDKGVLLLAGKAATFSDQLRAITDTNEIPGVNKVATEIASPETYGVNEYRFPEDKSDTRNSISDTRMTTEVKLNLLTAPAVPSRDINVDTYDGVVTLFGAVPTDAAKSAAERAARRVDGVLRVKNELEVRPGGREETAASDSAIKKDLQTRFKGLSQFKDVSLEVAAGRVQLTGMVDSSWDRLQAVRIARLSRGVKSVEDQLKLNPKADEAFRQN